MWCLKCFQLSRLRLLVTCSSSSNCDRLLLRQKTWLPSLMSIEMAIIKEVCSHLRLICLLQLIRRPLYGKW
jgi:hypothetical protein